MKVVIIHTGLSEIMPSRGSLELPEAASCWISAAICDAVNTASRRAVDVSTATMVIDTYVTSNDNTVLKRPQ